MSDALLEVVDEVAAAASTDVWGRPAPVAGVARHGRLKRAFDLLIAIPAVILLVPVFVLLALAIRLDSPGPAVFRQQRVGWRGRVFGMFKFRTMRDGSHDLRGTLDPLNEAGLFKLKDDPRLTRVGRMLRRASLDELPQLFNVLRGDMSLVGPRPLIPEEDRMIEGPCRARLSCTPGMTGPWQVLGPARPSLDEMVELDCLYAGDWSLATDLKLLWRTLTHVVRLRGV